MAGVYAFPYTTTVAIGKIPEGVSFEKAKQWLINHCKSSGTKAPQEKAIFFKGLSYNGILFAKYLTLAERDNYRVCRHTLHCH